MKRSLSAAMLGAALLVGVSAHAAAPAAKRAAKPAAKVQILPFIHDDYAQALARAKTKKVPIFVEAWAPW
ncbi:MAG: hypothetical protein ACYC7A_19235 [Thermoanaerobaculia bacterium]